MTLDDAAIERLVAEAQAGDAWAFGSLFDHYHLPIYRYIASRVHRPSDAEDLTQLVFVKALEALPRYEARGIPFGGWLFRLARNTVIDHVRTHHEHVDLDAAAVHAGTDAGPDEVTVARQELDEVAVALATLTDEQRDAIALALLRRPVGPRSRRGDGQAGRNGPRAPVPGDRRVAAPAPDRRARGGWWGRRPARTAGSLMDDAMIDLMAGDAELRRRLMAFAETRLTPDLGGDEPDARDASSRPRIDRPTSPAPMRASRSCPARPTRSPSRTA